MKISAGTGTSITPMLLLLPSFLGGCYGYPRYRTVMALSQPSTASSSSLSQPLLLRKQHRIESTTIPVVVVPATTTVSCRRNQSCRRNLRDDTSDDNKDEQDDAVVTASSSNNHSGSNVPSETLPSSVFMSNTENTAAATTDRSNRGVVLLVGIGVAAVVVLIALLLLILLRSDKVRTRCSCRHTTKLAHHHHPKVTSSSWKDGPLSDNNHESTTSREEDMNHSSFSSHNSPPPSGRSVDNSSAWYDQSLITMEGFTITGESDAGKTISIRSGFTIPSQTGGGAGDGIITTTARSAQRNTCMDDDISLADDIVSCLDSSMAMTDHDPSFVVVTRTISLPPTRRLGIQIGNTANGPTIRSVRHDSPCADYLFEGDVIIQLDGESVITHRPHDDTNRSQEETGETQFLSATEIAQWLDERCHEPRRNITVQSRLEQ